MQDPIECASTTNTEGIEYAKVYAKFIDHLESRVIKSWASSWCAFFTRCLLYGLSVFVCASSVLLYTRKFISATDFGYIMPLSALSSAALLFASTFIMSERKSEILFDVGIDLISEFLPSSATRRRRRSRPLSEKMDQESD